MGGSRWLEVIRGEERRGCDGWEGERRAAAAAAAPSGKQSGNTGKGSTRVSWV